jgi:hypothetical protein
MGMKALVFLALFITFQTALGAEPASSQANSAGPSLRFFKNTYEEADKDFNEIFASVKAQNPRAEVFQFLYPQGNIKSYYIPSEGAPKNLLVLISGVHGIEGHTGSAVQRYLLSKKMAGPQTGILMIHGFNLWGFKNGRRVNENNIDLNRNFILDRNHFKPDDTQYAMLNDFLNPTETPSENLFSHGLFLMKAVMKIVKYSIEPLRASILKGQYSFDQGLFYGGKDPQEQELMIQQLIARYFKPYKKVLLVDLHTGYGERGRLHLLAGKAADPNSQELKKIFSENEIDFADKKHFYAVQGEMITYFGEQIAQTTHAFVVGVTFEYGTLDTQKTTGSIESLRRMILENQDFHYAGSSDHDKIKSLFTEMFYPSDEEWRTRVLTQTDEKIQKVISYLNQ